VAADLETYRQTLIDLYLRLSDTPCRLSSLDLRLVRQLWERQVHLRVVEMAILLASARRAARPATPCPPVSSAHCITSCRSSKSFARLPSVTMAPTSLTYAPRLRFAPPSLPAETDKRISKPLK
jgi:hypothetical protein